MMYKDYLVRLGRPSLDWVPGEDEDSIEQEYDTGDVVPSGWMDQWWGETVKI